MTFEPKASFCSALLLAPGGRPKRLTFLAPDGQASGHYLARNNQLEVLHRHPLPRLCGGSYPLNSAKQAN